MLAAAAVAVIATGAGGFSLLAGDDQTASPPGTDSGAVSDDFTCPAQHTIDFASDNQDEFLAGESDELGGPRKFAEEYDAPRYEFVGAGDTATLRLGNADGSLGSITTYRRRPGAAGNRSPRRCALAPAAARAVRRPRS